MDRALERIEDLQWELELMAGDTEKRDKLLKQAREFDGYIGEHFKPGAMRPSYEFASPVRFAFSDTSE